MTRRQSPKRLAESPFATQIRANVGPLQTLFVTLFFSSIGMLSNPAWVVGNWVALVAAVVAIVVGKAFGGIIIENVFSLPGIGRLVFQAITQRDLIVVQNVVIVLVFAVVMVTFLIDIAYSVVDPRLRRSAK